MTVTIRPYRGRKEQWELDIRFKWPDGTVHRQRLRAPMPSKSAARRWGQDCERAEYELGPPQTRKEKLKQETIPSLQAFVPRFVEEYLVAERRKPSTINGYERVLQQHLLPMFGRRKLDSFELVDIQKLKAKLAHNKPGTVNNVLSALNMILKVAAEWGVIETMPCTIRMLKIFHDERPYYLPADYLHLIDTARKIDPRTELIVLLGGDAGLRLGEMIALEWGRVNFVRNVIVVARSIWQGHVSTPKSNRVREVPMTKRLRAALKAHRHLRGEEVLVQNNGKTCGYPETSSTRAAQSSPQKRTPSLGVRARDEPEGVFQDPLKTRRTRPWRVDSRHSVPRSQNRPNRRGRGKWRKRTGIEELESGNSK